MQIFDVYNNKLASDICFSEENSDNLFDCYRKCLVRSVSSEDLVDGLFTEKNTASRVSKKKVH